MMNMMKIIITAFILLMAVTAPAQDIIVKTDKSELKVRVLEILSSDVKYKRWDMQDGPTYTIGKTDIFMIIYQNGEREVFDEVPVNSPVNSPGTTPEETPTTAIIESAASKAVGLSEYQFTRETDRGIGSIGVVLNSIGVTMIPTIHLLRDEFVGKTNAAISWGLHLNGHYTEAGGVEVSNLLTTGLLGAAYYFNELFKLDKSKAAVYAGGLLGVSYSYTTVVTFGDVGGGDLSTSSVDFGFMFRLGGSYRLGKRVGIFGDVLVGRGDPGFAAGINIYSKQRR